MFRQLMVDNCPPLGKVVDYLEYGLINVVLTIQVC